MLAIIKKNFQLKIVGLYVHTCDKISSPCKSLFFKLPIIKSDKHLLAASAAFTRNNKISIVSRKNGI